MKSCNNVNTLETFKTEEQRDTAQRKNIRSLATLAMVVFDTTIAISGFHSASSLPASGSCQYFFNVNIGFFFSSA